MIWTLVPESGKLWTRRHHVFGKTNTACAQIKRVVVSCLKENRHSTQFYCRSVAVHFFVSWVHAFSFCNVRVWRHITDPRTLQYFVFGSENPNLIQLPTNLWLLFGLADHSRHTVNPSKHLGTHLNGAPLWGGRLLARRPLVLFLSFLVRNGHFLIGFVAVLLFCCPSVAVDFFLSRVSEFSLCKRQGLVTSRKSPCLGTDLLPVPRFVPTAMHLGFRQICILIIMKFEKLVQNFMYHCPHDE